MYVFSGQVSEGTEDKEKRQHSTNFSFDAHLAFMDTFS